MKELFLVCALALPSHLDSDYSLLKKFFEQRFPQHTVVFVNEDEELLNEGAKRLPFYVIGKTSKGRGLQLWFLDRSP